MSLIEKVTHCVACNAPLTEEDIDQGFETCIDCDLSGDDLIENEDEEEVN